MPTSPERATLAEKQTVIYRIVESVMKSDPALQISPNRKEIDVWIGEHRATKDKPFRVDQNDSRVMVATAAYSGLRASATAVEADIAIAVLERYLCGVCQLSHRQVDRLELEQAA